MSALSKSMSIFGLAATALLAGCGPNQVRSASESEDYHSKLLASEFIKTHKSFKDRADRTFEVITLDQPPGYTTTIVYKNSYDSSPAVSIVPKLPVTAPAP